MADIAGLFGVTPEALNQQRYMQDLKQGYEMAQLSPGDAARAGLQASVGQLGRGIAGLMGIEDPQMKLIAARQSIISQMDQNDPQSMAMAAQKLNQVGDTQGAVALMDRSKALQESATKIALQQAQTIKALQPNKLTGDERYRADLLTVEQKLLEGKEPTQLELSAANMAGQILAKPRSFNDPTSGQLITVPGTDPSKAFPLTYKQMAKLGSEAGTTMPKASVQQATEGNLPAGSVKEIADIDANIVKLQNSKPELQSFLSSLKSGDVKYNATSNTLDLLGATVLPAFGLPETGSQVKKDEIKRALTERVNSLLLMAKGTQTEGDAARAADQIASSTTYLSQARMTGAIEGLIKAEDKLNSELGAKKTALQTQGRTSAPNEPSTPKSSAPKPMAKPTELTREQKIQLFIDHNGGKPTRQQAENALRQAGKL
jgi:hypothetical protein